MFATKVRAFLLIVCIAFSFGANTRPIGAEAPVPSGSIGAIVTQVSLQTNDLIYEPNSNAILASVPSTAGANGNSIVAINPESGEIGTPLFVGSEPNKLAVSRNGEYLYVGLDGASGVRRVNLISNTVDIQFSLGTSSFCGNLAVDDMEVLPDDASAVAVSLRRTGCSPRHGGVAVYDDGVKRPDVTADHTGSNVIEFSESSSVLYGYNNESTEYGFRTMSVSNSGVSVTSTVSSLISGFGLDILFEAGVVYASSGQAIDPLAGTLLGTYTASGSGFSINSYVSVDSAKDQVYLLRSDNFNSTTKLHVFDRTRFTEIAAVTIPNVVGRVSSFIRMGEDSFAFRSDAGQVYLVKLETFDYQTYLPSLEN